MDMRLRSHRAFALLCLAPCFSSHLAGQQTNESPGGVPNIQVNVRRILVPVVVRDQQGRLVTDLKREDFQVIDNNKPHAISDFTVQTRQATPTGSGGEVASDSPPPPGATLRPARAEYHFAF